VGVPLVAFRLKKRVDENGNEVRRRRCRASSKSCASALLDPPAALPPIRFSARTQAARRALAARAAASN
jgi:hypothetical protein